MTSEERFKKLWNERFKYLGIGGLMSYEDFSKSIWLEATRQAYEDAADIIDITRSDALLMAGEMTAQEWRTVSAILVALQARLKELSSGPAKI